jgi:hypothetical protein
MKASQIFHKTTKGRSEIEARTDALSFKERRVLILVDGNNNASTLVQLSQGNNIAEILTTLLDKGFIERDDAASSGSATSGGTVSALLLFPGLDPVNVNRVHTLPCIIDFNLPYSSRVPAQG